MAPFMLQLLAATRSLLPEKEPVAEISQNFDNGLMYTRITMFRLSDALSYWFCMAKATTLVHGAIASEVYRRHHYFSIINTDDSTAMIMMRTDVEHVVIGMRTMHELWENVVNVGILIYSFQQQLDLLSSLALDVALEKTTKHLMGAVGRRSSDKTNHIDKAPVVTATV
ncbi:Canalicular multispecific organic anion transporter 1 [Pyrenophora tritici-repentis]|nr:Canalicular multispecific organic anion transporter 1 [Pyrenophora tritici-repentis]KAI1526245.1 ABC transporter [Pyrenophora tritici-repentis]